MEVRLNNIGYSIIHLDSWNNTSNMIYNSLLTMYCMYVCMSTKVQNSYFDENWYPNFFWAAKSESATIFSNF